MTAAPSVKCRGSRRKRGEGSHSVITPRRNNHGGYRIEGTVTAVRADNRPRDATTTRPGLGGRQHQVHAQRLVIKATAPHHVDSHGSTQTAREITARQSARPNATQRQDFVRINFAWVKLSCSQARSNSRARGAQASRRQMHDQVPRLPGALAFARAAAMTILSTLRSTAWADPKLEDMGRPLTDAAESVGGSVVARALEGDHVRDHAPCQRPR